MIYPYLIYGNIVWANTYPFNLHKLYLLQKQFVSLATLSDSNKASSHVCLYINMCSCLFLCRHQQRSNFFKFSSQVHSHNTRQVNHLHLHFYKTNHGLHSLRYEGVQIWNAKIHVIKISLSLESFKRKLSSHLIHDVYFFMCTYTYIVFLCCYWIVVCRVVHCCCFFLLILCFLLSFTFLLLLYFPKSRQLSLYFFFFFKNFFKFFSVFVICLFFSLRCREVRCISLWLVDLS